MESSLFARCLNPIIACSSSAAAAYKLNMTGDTLQYLVKYNPLIQYKYVLSRGQCTCECIYTCTCPLCKLTLKTVCSGCLCLHQFGTCSVTES
ncbi:hypothetical protein F5B22DRAFT_593941, partial [Xylaria bambusicola]|uniref:uncharacterized protein n=1 Tax=Xylaria bambusicola TaxID=326684 RepID=UPI0020082573